MQIRPGSPIALLAGLLMAAAIQADELWQPFGHDDPMGLGEIEEIELHYRTEGKGEQVRLFIRATCIDRGSEGCESLQIMREFCMFWTCGNGDYEGTKETGMPVHERLEGYLVDRKLRKYSELFTRWSGFDQEPLGQLMVAPAPQKASVDFPKEGDQISRQFLKILEQVSKQPE